MRLLDAINAWWNIRILTQIGVSEIHETKSCSLYSDIVVVSVILQEGTKHYYDNFDQRRCQRHLARPSW